MTIRSVGFLALHSCPLAALGEGKAGGMSSYVLGLARELARRGIAVKIITNEHGEAHDFRAACDGFEVAHVLPKREEIASALGDDCDVIHSHYWVSGLAGLDVARRLDIPHVVTFHTIGAVKDALTPALSQGERELKDTFTLRQAQGERALRGEAEGVVARGVDGIVAWTRYEAEALVSLLGADPGRVTVAPIGVDSGRFRPMNQAEARARLRIPLDEETLLYVGRLDPIKGADVLLKSFGLLSDRPRARLRIIGGEVDAEYTALLRGLVSELDIADRVTWTGIAPNNELPCHYAAADALIVPSHSESFSIVAAEAMACGTPVVASNVPGPASFIQDGVSGRLVPTGDAPALAAAISHLLDDEGLRRRLGDGALEAARGLTWEASGDAVLGVYEGVMRS